MEIKRHERKSKHLRPLRIDVSNKQIGKPIIGLTVDDFILSDGIELKQIDETTFQLYYI